MMRENLSGMVTVVTGATAGIGAAIARRFAEKQSRVVVAARRQSRLEKLAAEIRDQGGEALPVVCDVTDYGQVESLVDRTIKEFGRVDVMVNNAGFGHLKPFMDSTVAEIDDQINVNFKGLCYGCMAALKPMLERGSGHLINIGSVGSVRHYASFAVYCGAKHAVLGFSRSLYEEVRDKGIRVSLLCPGAVNTEFLDVAGFQEVPWKTEDMIQPEDVADLAVTCVSLPAKVQLDTMVIWPTCQVT